MLCLAKQSLDYSKVNKCKYLLTLLNPHNGGWAGTLHIVNGNNIMGELGYQFVINKIPKLMYTRGIIDISIQEVAIVHLLM